MVFFTVFLQGGTIKLFVKLFKIELATKDNPKDNPRICNDVQGILMEDVMQGIGTVIGRQKAEGIFSEFWRALDKLLKNILIEKENKQELQQKMEKICLDEHITNLYAPRIIANQETTRETEETKKENNI